MKIKWFSSLELIFIPSEKKNENLRQPAFIAYVAVKWIS